MSATLQFGAAGARPIARKRVSDRYAAGGDHFAP
jgi:hypothetical protein